MSTRLKSIPRSPYASQVFIGGEMFRVRTDPSTNRRFIGDYEEDAFVGKLILQGRRDSLSDVYRIEWPEMAAKGDPSRQTAFEINRQRRRRN